MRKKKKKKTVSGTKQSISEIEFESLKKSVEKSVIESLTKELKEVIDSIFHTLQK